MNILYKISTYSNRLIETPDIYYVVAKSPNEAEEMVSDHVNLHFTHCNIEVIAQGEDYGSPYTLLQ